MSTNLDNEMVNNECREVCEIHAENIVEYFCKGHDQFCCSACVATEHRTCEKLEYIPEVAFTFDKSKELTDIQTGLRELLSSNERQKSELNNKVKAVSIQAERAKMQVKNLRAKIDKLFDDLEKKIDISIDTLKTADENTLEGLICKANTDSEQLQKHTGDINQYLNTRTPCYLYVAARRARDHIKDLSEEMTKVDHDMSIKRYQFIPNSNITELISSLKSIGTLDAMDQRAKVPKFEKDINTRDVSEKEKCEITGVAIPVKQRLVVADNRNESVKLIDTEKDEIKCVYKVKGVGSATKPFDVTTIDSSRVAATYPYRRRIQFLEISDCNQLKMTKEITATGECVGIAYAGKNLVVSFRKPAMVKVLTMSGTVIKTIKERFTEFPDYLAVNQNKNLVYISNWSSPGPGSVISVTIDGKSIAAFENEKLYGPHGASVDQRGVVHVCGRFLHNVLQLSEDCTIIQELLNKEDGLKMPRCITLSEQNDKLYVAIDKDYIKVFHLY